MKLAREGNNAVGAAAPSPTSRSRRSAVKKYLIGLLILGALSSTMATGTFASFTAEVDNPGSVKTGTLVLESKGSAPVTDCFSNDPAAVSHVVTGGNIGACSAIFTSAISGAGGTVTQELTVINQGSITPTSGNFKITCGNDSNPSTNGFSGSADLCTITSVLVAETTLVGGTIISASGSQLYGTCPDTIPANCVQATAPLSSGAGTTVPLSAAQRTGTHFYFIKVTMTAALDNSYQGRAAGLSFNWSLTE